MKITVLMNYGLPHGIVLVEETTETIPGGVRKSRERVATHAHMVSSAKQMCKQCSERKTEQANLSLLKVKDLRELAKQYGIKGAAKMKKADLVAALVNKAE